MEYNATATIVKCNPESQAFGNAGNIEVMYDQDSLYVSFIASNNFSLTKSSLHLAGALGEFSTVGQGNLPAGQLDYQKIFNGTRPQYTFSFALDQLQDCILIAANGSFSNGTEAGSFWAGDIPVNNGNWFYFEYCTQTCLNPCEGLAGRDNSITLTIAQVEENYYCVSRLETLYNRLLETFVRGTGTFNPTIADRNAKFVNASIKTGIYTPTYTFIMGDCSDSAEISVEVTE